MAIQIGQRLGPYEIVSQIGAGGMGEVEALWRREPVLNEVEGSRQPKSRLPRAKSRGAEQGISHA